ncbi:hypothetical protein AMIS_47810 [Actinoplanes missouriensis 431]|uniref:Uncharacterized protein n=1 Tax=Actinoplanes missouriensis (strain ATCC 14538 / DSM 43046 / CBS 188.64 / JCM 3121 / NBRC 102363 / NCIMB 12654 / NRRL B-3342 / UNCC 431) TaxID=512565 RepID=I0HAG4_ACTM4|nr:hypothetical protein AMIS_47810 [Actinoplanes missouriensis 431]
MWRFINARAGMEAHEPFRCDLIAVGVSFGVPPPAHEPTVSRPAAHRPNVRST